MSSRSFDQALKPLVDKGATFSNTVRSLEELVEGDSIVPRLYVLLRDQTHPKREVHHVNLLPCHYMANVPESFEATSDEGVGGQANPHVLWRFLSFQASSQSILKLPCYEFLAARFFDLYGCARCLGGHHRIHRQCSQRDVADDRQPPPFEWTQGAPTSVRIIWQDLHSFWVQ